MLPLHYLKKEQLYRNILRRQKLPTNSVPWIAFAVAALMSGVASIDFCNNPANIVTTYEAGHATADKTNIVDVFLYHFLCISAGVVFVVGASCCLISVMGYYLIVNLKFQILKHLNNND